MVTRAGKDFLRNTLRSTDYHNRLIEEEEMWKQWETEKGLTMMVTDDYLRRRMRMDEYPGPSCNAPRIGTDFKRRRSRSETTSEDNPWTRKLMQTEEQDTERWGHSGYKELYPEEFKNRKLSSSESENDEKDIEVESKARRKRKLKRHKRHKKKSTKKSKPNYETDSETEELRRDIRNIQRQKRGLPLIEKKNEYSSSDSDVKIIGVSAPRLPPKRFGNEISQKEQKT